MASLSEARSTLVDLKVQLAKSNQEYFTLLASNESTTAVLANIATLRTAITNQTQAVRLASGYRTLANVVVSTTSSISSTFDTIPVSGSTKAMESGGAFTALAAKEPTLVPSSDITLGNVTTAKVTTSGNIMCSGNILGTLTTSAQPGITSIGTLTALQVEGPISITSAALDVDSVNNRVGINKSSPQHTLDIDGDLNTTGAFLYEGIIALDHGTNALGAEITSSNLSTIGTLTSLVVSGNVDIDSNTLAVNSITNRVGISQPNPQYGLDVVGDTNLSANYNIGNAQVLTLGNTLGPIVVTSNLSTIGTLTGANVAGNISQINGTASVKDVTAGNVTVGGNLRVSGISTFGSVTNMYGIWDRLLDEGAHLSWNHNIGVGETDLVNKSGLGSGGIYFYNSTGNDTDWTNRSLLASLNATDFVCNSYSQFQVPCFKVVKVENKGSAGETFPPGSFVFTTNPGDEIFFGNFSHIVLDVKPSGSTRGWNRDAGAYEAPIAGYYRFDVYIRLNDGSTGYGFKPRRLHGANYGNVDYAVRGNNNEVFVTRDGTRPTGTYYTIMYMNEGDRFAVQAGTSASSQSVYEVQMSGCFLST